MKEVEEEVEEEIEELKSKKMKKKLTLMTTDDEDVADEMKSEEKE
jgi:hypothetical protein